MASPAPSRRALRFGPFEVDLRAPELRKNGSRIRLQEQPFQVLVLLLERPGELVTREELQQKLWPADTFVDFEVGLNNAVKKLREALGDRVASPRFIETVPKRGYRFIADVSSAAPVDIEAPASKEARERRVSKRPIFILSLLVLMGVAALWLPRLLRQPPSPTRPLLAVLPFENMSGDPEQEYFADGLTEEMIASVAQFSPHDLGVIARTSAMQYKRTNKGIDQIGRELGVNYVLEGSVRREGEGVRITAQLIRVSDQTHLWAQSYDRPLTEVLRLQNDVAREVAIATGVQLAQAAGIASDRPRSTVNPQAYVAHMRGRHLSSFRSPGNFHAALQYFQEAIRLDPEYAPAYASLAAAYGGAPYYGLMPPAEAFSHAREAALRALQLDPAIPDGHIFLARLSLVDRDWQAAEENYVQALKLYPNARAHHLYALFLTQMGRIEEGARHTQAALRLDPLSLIINKSVGDFSYYMGNYDAAITAYERTLEMNPQFTEARLFLGLACEQKGVLDEAVAHLQMAVDGGDGPKSMAALARAHAKAGDTTAARRAFAQLSQWDGYVDPYHVALVHIALGEVDEAFKQLDRAFEDSSVWLRFIKIDPRLHELRDDPRLTALMRRMNLG